MIECANPNALPWSNAFAIVGFVFGIALIVFAVSWGTR
jgi:hypothetical protein